MDSSASPNDFVLPTKFPPPGVAINFVNPTSRAYDLILASALCIPFMTICVTIRFYTKLFIKKTWGWDDWFCIPATIGTLGFAGVSLSTLGEGVGPHQWDVPITAFTPSLLRRFVTIDLLYSPTALMAKLSLLLLYLRIFNPNQRTKYCIYITACVLTLFYTATFVGFAVFSIPRRGESQLQSILSVNTARNIPLGITQGAVNVLSDFFIFCLPIPVIWKLQLSPKKRIAYMAVFMTGLLACIASAFGLYYRATMGRNSDVTWKLVFVLLWVVVELTVGVTCSCLPSFPGFVRHYSPHFRSFVSVFSSRLKRLHYPNQRRPISSSSSEKRLATKDIKITLGSRVDGEGRFLDLENGFSAGENPLSHPNDAYNPTRRDGYEDSSSAFRTTGRGPAPSNDRPSRDSAWKELTSHEDLGSNTGSKSWRWWKRSGNATRTGYWDVMSIFRTGNTSSTGQPRAVSDSGYDSTITGNGGPHGERA